ncbi:MAG: N-acetyltransferase family protein, partial [Phototrophicaceae bacterium]
MNIRPMQASDWSQVTKIYTEGIAGRNATFETTVPQWEAWDEKHLMIGRLVAENMSGAVLGWVALSAVSHRFVYRGVTENTIYIATDAQGQGVGSALLQALIDASEAAHIWTILAVTFEENTASIALHQKFGFRMVGYRERIAQLDGIWRNTVMMERRSKVVG